MRDLRERRSGVRRDRWREIIPDLVVAHRGVQRAYDLKILTYCATNYRRAAEVAAPVAPRRPPSRPTRTGSLRWSGSPNSRSA